MSPVKLVNALQGDGTAFLGGEPYSDLLPRFALAALLANEFDVRFETAVKSGAAACFHSCWVTHGFRSHRHEITPGGAPGVSEQWASAAEWWQS